MRILSHYLGLITNKMMHSIWDLERNCMPAPCSFLAFLHDCFTGVSPIHLSLMAAISVRWIMHFVKAKLFFPMAIVKFIWVSWHMNLRKPLQSTWIILNFCHPFNYSTLPDNSKSTT